ncbi:MAG: hypothetical protein ABSG62_21330 [Terracidiphilus sp.]|jgi:hypothetical protein
MRTGPVGSAGPLAGHGPEVFGRPRVVARGIVLDRSGQLVGGSRVELQELVSQADIALLRTLMKLFKCGDGMRNSILLVRIAPGKDGRVILLALGIGLNEALRNQPTKHARYYWLTLAEGHQTKARFAVMLRRIALLPLAAN